MTASGTTQSSAPLGTAKTQSSRNALRRATYTLPPHPRREHGYLWRRSAGNRETEQQRAEIGNAAMRIVFASHRPLPGMRNQSGTQKTFRTYGEALEAPAADVAGLAHGALGPVAAPQPRLVRRAASPQRIAMSAE